MALRARTAQLRRQRGVQLKRFYLVAGGVLVAVMLTVLFVPGVSEYIEGQVLGWLARSAR